MRVFGGTDREIMRALWRGLLLCLALAVATAQVDAAARNGDEHAPPAHAAELSPTTPDMPMDWGCHATGHCGQALAILPPVLHLVPAPGGPLIFARSERLKIRGRTVDPGLHPPQRNRLR